MSSIIELVGKLLSAHGVAAARDADELSCRIGSPQRALEVRGGGDRHAISRTRVGLSCEWMSLTSTPVSAALRLQRERRPTLSRNLYG